MDIKNPQNLKKALAIVSTSTLLAAFGTPSVVPVVKPAVVYAAGAEVDTVTSVPTIKDTVSNAKLATIRIKFTKGTVLETDDFVVVELPDDFEFATLPDRTVSNAYSGSGNAVVAVGFGSDYSFSVDPKKDRLTIKVSTSNGTPLADDAYLYIYLGNIKVNGADNGPAEVELTTNATGSAFPQGKVTVANVVGNGEVQLSVVDDMTSNDEFTTVVRIKELTAGSLEKDVETLKFTLPDGYKWKGIKVKSSTDYTVDEEGNHIAQDGDIVYVPAINGQNVFFRLHIDDEKLKLDLVAVDGSDDGKYYSDVDNNNDGTPDTRVYDTFTEGGATYTETETATTKPSIWELPLVFAVDDESKITPGDVIVRVSGETDANVSELVVGKYGDYSATVSVDSVKTLFAGQDDQNLGEITIEEALGGSLVKDRTITLTLPEGARWQEEFEATLDGRDPGTAESWSKEQSGGLTVKFVGYTGPDKRTAKFTVSSPTNSGSKGGKIKFKDLKIAVAPNYTGPIEIEIGGTAGVSDTVKVADVVSPVDAKVENLRDVIIGATNQVAGDLVITEKAAGVLDDDADLIVALPSGVKFVDTPKVEVTSGDLRVGTVKVQKGDNGTDSELAIRIEKDSTKPSTIRISNIQLNLDRTVPEGALDVEIKGDAVLTTNVYEDWKGFDYVAKAAIANVVTPAPSDQKATVVFTVDNTKYTVNGVEKTADVAPYIKDGRTFLPVRYVAEALGVSSDNILWDAATKTVTLFKGDRVVKLKIGSKVLYVNGTAITMDVAPEIKNGRTMLPIRWVGTALGVTVEWDEQARTVTVKQ